MGLLDSIDKSDVQYNSHIIWTNCSYGINDDIDCDELLRNSPYRLHLLFEDSFWKERSVLTCERHSRDLIEKLSYIPKIAELSNVCIVKDGKFYKLVFGMNFYYMSPYSAVWTFASIIEMMKKARICTDDTKIYIRGYKDGRILERLEYGDYVETYNIGMNYERYTRINFIKGDIRFRFSKEMHELHRTLFEYIIGRPIEKEEWDECVNRSYMRYKKIYPIKMKT